MKCQIDFTKTFKGSNDDIQIRIESLMRCRFNMKTEFTDTGFKFSRKITAKEWAYLVGYVDALNLCDYGLDS